VEETNSGLCVNPGDYKALAKAVMNLRLNEKIARTMGINGRKLVEKEDSIQAIGFQMKTILESC
jgi:glycosyltransferase involved in cell wall biosynthesis